jgi:hypothetical protein
MNEPKHQHFIPRSYLNNFAKRDNDTFIIYGKKRGNDKILPLSTKDICVNKNLYTLPIQDSNKKFQIEHFYANSIDNKFPKLYKTLKDKKIITLDLESKIMIISTALSLYFRTPKFLDIQNHIYKKIEKEISRKIKSDTISFKMFNVPVSINKVEALEIIKEKKENNRMKFLFEHLENYEKLVQSKITDNICVYHISDESEFITCDNPVIIRPNADPSDENFNYNEYYSQQINPFEPKNTIHLPIDRKTLLTILPSPDKKSYNLLQRLEVGITDVIIYNSEIEKYSDKWILGSEEGIGNHLKDQQKYSELNHENSTIAENYIDLTLEIKKLVELLEKYGPKNDLVIEQINFMQKKPHINSDNNFKRMVQLILEEK